MTKSDLSLEVHKNFDDYILELLLKREVRSCLNSFGEIDKQTSVSKYILSRGYKISLILSSRWMGFKEVFYE